MQIKAWALVVLISILSQTVQAENEKLPNGPHVVTFGQASVEAKPDIATLLIKVVISLKDAAEAKKLVDTRVAQYFKLLHENGIENNDINAANLRTQPEYDYNSGNKVLKAYSAVREVRVTLRQLDRLNDLLDGALKSGLNEIRAIELGVAHPEEYRNQAHKEAIKSATTRAATLAEGFNTKLGSIYSIRYNSVNDRPMPMERMLLAYDSAAITSAEQTYEQKSIYFDDRVDVVFELQHNQR